MATMRCEIVSAEESLFQGDVCKLSARGTIGELGILPGHTPLLTGIAPGSVLLEKEDGTEEIFYASGGYIEVQPDMVTLLADTALRAKDLDEAEAELSRQEAERAMNEKVTEIEFTEAAARLSQAMAQQRTMEELRRRRG